MGLTLIRKSDGAPKRNPRIALVLAGGAVSGGAFKVGGLKALNDFLVERKITDMDLYVGLSAGAILGSSLAAGITPDEMIKVLDVTSTRLDQLRPFDFYNPNLREILGRPVKLGARLATYLPGLLLDTAPAGAAVEVAVAGRAPEGADFTAATTHVCGTERVPAQARAVGGEQIQVAVAVHVRGSQSIGGGGRGHVARGAE